MCVCIYIYMYAYICAYMYIIYTNILPPIRHNYTCKSHNYTCKSRVSHHLHNACPTAILKHLRHSSRWTGSQ